MFSVCQYFLSYFLRGVSLLLTSHGNISDVSPINELNSTPFTYLDNLPGSYRVFVPHFFHYTCGPYVVVLGCHIHGPLNVCHADTDLLCKHHTLPIRTNHHQLKVRKIQSTKFQLIYRENIQLHKTHVFINHSYIGSVCTQLHYKVLRNILNVA